jgi:hypothetical protein
MRERECVRACLPKRSVCTIYLRSCLELSCNCIIYWFYTVTCYVLFHFLHTQNYVPSFLQDRVAQLICCRFDGPGSVPRKGRDFFVTSRLAGGVHPPPWQLITRRPFPKDKVCVCHDGDHAFPSSAKTKNICSYTCTSSYTMVWLTVEACGITSAGIPVYTHAYV